MSSSVDPQPSVPRWHAVGLAAYLLMLGLYFATGRYADGAEADPQLHWVLGGAALLAGLTALVGRHYGWQQRRALLIAWPAASLAVTILTGLVEPDATRNLPGTITITFAFVGLTCRRWRSLLLLPLGIAAFVAGRGSGWSEQLPTVVVTAIMWVLVAEVPAWLIARLEAQSMILRQIAQTDALTQLLDRSTLAPRLSLHGSKSAVVLIDLDNFKNYNDRHGHEAGDQLLVAFSGALRWSVRKQDMAFRIGGDEFLLLLIGADHAEAEQVLDRLRRRWTEGGAPVGFSAGIATGEQDLMRVADERMYSKKRYRKPSADGL